MYILFLLGSDLITDIKNWGHFPFEENLGSLVLLFDATVGPKPLCSFSAI